MGNNVKQVNEISLFIDCENRPIRKAELILHLKVKGLQPRRCDYGPPARAITYQLCPPGEPTWRTPRPARSGLFLALTRAHQRWPLCSPARAACVSTWLGEVYSCNSEELQETLPTRRTWPPSPCQNGEVKWAPTDKKKEQWQQIYRVIEHSDDVTEKSIDRCFLFTWSCGKM